MQHECCAFSSCLMPVSPGWQQISLSKYTRSEDDGEDKVLLKSWGRKNMLLLALLFHRQVNTQVCDYKP